MTLQERSDLVLTFARLLYVNGQSTYDTLRSAERLSSYLGLRVSILLRWGELQLQATDGTTQLLSLATASPTDVDMQRVASATRAIEEIGESRLVPSVALDMAT